MVDINIYTYAMVPPGPPFSATTDEKVSYEAQSVETIDLADYPLDHEVCGAEIYFQGPWAPAGEVTTTFSAIELSTGRNISDGTLTVTVPTPGSLGYTYYEWYKVRFWIGHVIDEVSGPMTIRMTINVSGSGMTRITRTLDLNVIDSSEPQPSSLNLITIPSEANVIIDGEDIGLTPLAVLQEPRSIKNVTFRKSGYDDLTQLILWPDSGLEDTMTFTLTPSPPPPTTTSIQFTSDPEGATIYVDRELIGPTPVTVERDARSFHDVNAELEYYRTITTGIYWPGEGTTLFPLVLRRITPPEETPEYWIDQGYTREQAEAIASWIRENQQSPSPELIDLLITSLGLRERSESEDWTQKLLNWMDEVADSRWFGVVDFLFGPEESYRGSEDIQIVSGVVPLGTAAGTIPKTVGYLDDVAEAINPEILAKLTPVRRNLWSAITSKFSDDQVVNRMLKYICQIAVADVLFTWLAEDNITESIEFRSNKLLQRINEGEITKEEALNEFNKLEGFLNNARRFLQISTIANPLLWLFRGIIIDAVDQARVTFDENKEDVEAYIPEVPGVPSEGKGILVIDSDPADARITVGSEFPATGHFEKELDPGDYQVVVSKSGFIAESYTAEVTEGQTNSYFTRLNPEEEVPPEVVETGTLDLSISPEDSAVSVSGRPEITASGQYTLPQGSYDLRVEKSGFITDDRTFYINVGETTAVSVTLQEETVPAPEIQKAKVVVDSSPAGADVYINGQFKFTTTPYTIYLEPGDYTFRVQLEDYYPSEIELELEEADNIIIPFELTKIPADQTPISYPSPGIIYPPTLQVLTPPASSIVTVPSSQQITPQYQYLFTQFTDFPAVTESPAVSAGELLVNIETTDTKPWKGRIFSIAMLDLDNPEAAPVILVDQDEEALIDTFLGIFNAKDYSKFVGFKTSFDHRWLCAAAMRYRKQSKKLFEIEQKDIKQLMDQIQEQFVYFTDKAGTLDDWGKYLFGVGKLTTQETLLREFLQGNRTLVEQFQTRQLELEANLYALYRFSSSESQQIAPGTIQGTTLSPEITGAGPGDENNGQKICEHCLQANSPEAKECVVCHNEI